MKEYPVITISRQYGSGGREVGQLLAKRLGIPYYDNELITLAAQESGFSPELFANADQNASNSLLFSLSLYGTTAGTYNMPIGDQVFLIQSDIIRKVAEQGPCVIVGGALTMCFMRIRTACRYFCALRWNGGSSMPFPTMDLSG